MSQTNDCVEPSIEPIAEILTWFVCPSCDGHGCKVDRRKSGNQALLCESCKGDGRLGATESQVEAAQMIGSDNPFCRHDWNYSGTAYGGDDESYHGEGRCICSRCGADGDA